MIQFDEHMFQVGWFNHHYILRNICTWVVGLFWGRNSWSIIRREDKSGAEGLFWKHDYTKNLGLSPCPGTVTSRIIIFLVGNPYTPSFATVTGKGDNPNYTKLLNMFFLEFRLFSRLCSRRCWYSDRTYFG